MTKIKTNIFGAKVLEKATQSFIHYSNENELTEFLMFYIVIAEKYISENKTEAKQLIIDTYKHPTNEYSKMFIDLVKSEKSNQIFEMDFYSRHFSHMAYCRALDNFTTYFKEILAEVVIKKPQILKSKDQETLDFILSYTTIEDLLKAISEKKNRRNIS